MKVSIIIPCKKIDEKCQKCIKECLKLDYKSYEIIVLPDDVGKIKVTNPKIRIIKTGKTMPSMKRNIGMSHSDAEFYAFIDSDAYPQEDWLKNAMNYFEEDIDEKIGIVGGPNLTPKEGNFWEKVSGYVLSNFFASGKADIRYKVTNNQFTHELPSCNYIARKEASSEYERCFLTAEDSKFCFVCAKKGYKIFYAGDVVVYHHRRNSLKLHLKQIWIYARDIARLIKTDFSLEYLYYSLLSLFVIGFFAGGVLSFFNVLVRNLFLVALGFYLVLIFLTSLHENLRTSFWVFVTTVLTHFSYGIGFLWGLVGGGR